MNGLHGFLEKEREDICISVTKTLYIYIYNVFLIYISVLFQFTFWKTIEKCWKLV